MWLPYSILPSSISEGDFVVCRTMNGLNIGVVIEMIVNNYEDIDLEDCGEILGLATCEQMESFQEKLKKESYLLDLCRDYLMDVEEDKIVRLLDVEFEMDGSLKLYFTTTTNE